MKKFELVMLTFLSIATGSLAIEAPARADLVPVWQLDVTPNDTLPRAHVVVNAFENPDRKTAFPLREVPLILKVDRSKFINGRLSPDISGKIARLGVEPSGRLVTRPLEFMPGDAMSVNAWTGKMTTLALVDSADAKTPVGLFEESETFPVDSQTASAGEFASWEESPDRSWCVVHTYKGTQVYKRGQLLPKLQMRERTYGSFSRDGSRYAAVAYAESVRKWILLSSDCLVLREGTPTRGFLSQLYLSPNGNMLTFFRDGHLGRGEMVVVDLATGEERSVGNSHGTRYYSADGTTMLLLGSYPDVQLSDVRNPLNPVVLAVSAETTHDGVLTAAVSSDGSLFAVEMFEHDDPHRVLTRVVVFDRELRQRAVVLSRTRTLGLHFEGRHLFVGIHRHQTPAPLYFTSTTEIRLYDLTAL